MKESIYIDITTAKNGYVIKVGQFASEKNTEYFIADSAEAAGSRIRAVLERRANKPSRPKKPKP